MSIAYEEQQLYIAVMKQAIVDLFAGSPSASNPKEGDLIRREALLFLTAPTGPWADMRAEIGLVIDRDPKEVRETIIAILEGGDMPYLGDVRATGVEKARALWAEQKAFEEAAHAERLRRRAERPKREAPALPPPTPAAQKPALALVVPTPRPAPPMTKSGRVKETKRAAKPWLCPPRDPADDWLYGIASA
ncbi:MAG: hypothetical protein HC844_03690 [Tabrizicola sp.]|nr:hypothetical protein [Tabrizicola sp.]